MATPALAAQPADTNDWDTAFAIHFSDANNAIVAKKSSPPSFSAPYTDGLSGQQYTIAGNFGAWQLSGGSGGIVHMSLPVTGGTLTPQGGTARNYSGSGVIEVYLNFLPQPTSDSTNGQTNNLQVKLTTNDPVNQPVVTVQSFTFDPTSPLQQGAEAIQSALGTWLNANLQSFNHVFAAVDLNAVADQGAFQWLKPTKVGYAVNAPNNVTTDKYIFGVLCMTEDRDNPNLSNQISPNIIPTGATAGFLISQERFVNKIFLPGVYLIFKGATASNFTQTNDGATVTNTVPLSFQNFTLDDGTLITDASIGTGNFTLTAFDETMEMQFTDLNFTWKTGYIVHLSYTGLASLSLDANHNLQMTPTGKPSLNTVVTKTTEEQWKELIEGIVEGIALAVVGAVIGGALGPAAEEAAEAGETAATDAAESAEEGADAMNFDVEAAIPAEGLSVNGLLAVWPSIVRYGRG
jgi:Clostridium P-47 protein